MDQLICVWESGTKVNQDNEPTRCRTVVPHSFWFQCAPDNLGSGFTHILWPEDVYFSDMWGAETSPFRVSTLSSGTHMLNWFCAYWSLVEIAWAIRVGGSVSMIFQSCIKGDVKHTHTSFFQTWSKGDREWRWKQINCTYTCLSRNHMTSSMLSQAGVSHQEPQEVAPQGIRGAALVGYICPFICEIWMLAYSPKPNLFCVTCPIYWTSEKSKTDMGVS